MRRHFPLKLSVRGLDIRLQDAEASMPIDRNRILNTITGRVPANLGEEAHSTHPRYEHLNSLLRCRFAAVVLVSF